MAPGNCIDEYIAGFSEELQEKLASVRSTIAQAAPDAEEAIKYRIPTFVQGECLVHFAAFPKHIGFYATPSAMEHFKDEFAASKNRQGLGSISTHRAPAAEPYPKGCSIPGARNQGEGKKGLTFI